MKVLIKLAAIFLSAVIFIGCSDEFDRGLSNGGSVVAGGGAIKVTLNPTEQKLRGEWFLRSMATRDTLYNDSIENNKLTISFTEFAVPGDLPVFNENLKLYAKATPDSAGATAGSETYRAPDSTELIIYFKVMYQAPSYTVFQITRLAPYNLDLRDAITGKEWKFER